MSTKTDTAPEPRRKFGPDPAGPNGLTRDKLVATRVDKLERPAIHAMLTSYGYKPDGVGLRDLLLDLVSGDVRLTDVDRSPSLAAAA